ncbi:MAG: hypothetical protein GY798_13795 [Hyphomicrobiales bacterium]|nr:hypothetical protein [Hyphomicrobiales bacterium]
MLFIIRFCADYIVLQLTFDFLASAMTAFGADATSMIMMTVNLVSGLAEIIVIVMLAVAVHRLILFNDRRTGHTLLFSLRKAGRLFVAFGVVVVILQNLIVIALLDLAINIDLLVLTDRPMTLLVLIVYIPAFALFIRILSIYPIVVVERRMDFRLAWRMSKGNFFRLTAVMIFGLVIPVVLALLTLFFVLGPLVVAPILSFVFDDLATLNPLARVRAELLYSALGLTVPVILATIFLTSLFVALVSYSYRAFRGIPPGAYLDDETTAPALHGGKAAAVQDVDER